MKPAVSDNSTDEDHVVPAPLDTGRKPAPKPTRPAAVDSLSKPEPSLPEVVNRICKYASTEGDVASLLAQYSLLNQLTFGTGTPPQRQPETYVALSREARFEDVYEWTENGFRSVCREAAYPEEASSGSYQVYWFRMR